MPYWIESTLAALPAFLWMFLGVGIPAALAALPRRDWRDRVLVMACALAFGSASVTAWMAILGTLGGRDQTPLLNFPNTFVGSLVIALVFALIAWGKRRAPVGQASTAMRHHPLRDEHIIIGMIALGMVLIWITSAYWPFVHYDPIWVYGYQGRLYMLKGFIPQDIGYYPPFMALQYAYGQLAAGGMIDDHAARAGLPLVHLGSILMTYVLGARLFGVRAGIFAMGLWALYPHVAHWSGVGDLEIPLTYGFTGAAAFLLMAWHAQSRRDRWHYGALSGAFLGIAMWTKPTGGAFVLGVILLVVVEFVRVRFDLRAFLPRFEVAVAAGLASIPLGAFWYARNILLGHEAVRFPHEFWLTQSLRSGSEFGWGVLALIVLTAFFALARLNHRPPWRWIVSGLILLALALTATTFEPRRMTAPEYALLFAGVFTLALSLIRYAWRYASVPVWRDLTLIGWALLLALPYFLNWFYNYSYHYRLSFPIVPLLILPSAVILARWWSRSWVIALPLDRRRLFHVGVALACLPGMLIPLYHYQGGWDWLWTNRYPTDFSRRASFNPALTFTVSHLTARLESGNTVVAPGLERLPFYFPLEDIRITETPTRLDELVGVDFYIYTQEAAWYYEDQGRPLLNQVTGSMARPNVMQNYSAQVDSSFFSRSYAVREPERRFRPPAGERWVRLDESAVFDTFARLTHYRLESPVLSRETPLELTLAFEAIHAADHDYLVYVHLRDADDNVIATWDSPPAPVDNALYYSTILWDTGEYVLHPRTLHIPDDVPDGDGYRVVIGFYTLEDLVRVPVQVNGTLTDGWQVPLEISVR